MPLSSQRCAQVVPLVVQCRAQLVPLVVQCRAQVVPLVVQHCIYMYTRALYLGPYCFGTMFVSGCTDFGRLYIFVQILKIAGWPIWILAGPKGLQFTYLQP